MPPSVRNSTDPAVVDNMGSKIRTEIPEDLFKTLQEPETNNVNGSDVIIVNGNLFPNGSIFNVSNDKVHNVFRQSTDYEYISIQEQVIIGACSIVGIFVLIAVVLRIIMPSVRHKLKLENSCDESKHVEEIIKSDPSISTDSSEQSSSRGSSCHLASHGYHGHSDWSDSSSSNTKSSYFSSHLSRERLLAKLGSLASISGSSLSLPNLSSSKTRLNTLYANDKGERNKEKVQGDTENEQSSGLGSLTSVSNTTDCENDEEKNDKIHRTRIFVINSSYHDNMDKKT